MRKITSLTALLSFLLLALTSVILYIVPAGRVAYWADYRLWGLTKGEWGSLHINLGVLFLLAIILHTYYNWNAIMAYLKNKAKEFKLFTREFNISLLIVAVFSFGTYFEVQPFHGIITIGEAISAKAEKFYGEPPYGHAELSSLQTFSRKMGLDLELSMQRLREAGFAVESSEQAMLDIADANRSSPKEVYLIISPLNERVMSSFPSEPPPGVGKRPLIDLCQEYSINSKEVLRLLADQGITASEEMSLKEIAEGVGKDAVEIYYLIRDGMAEEQ